LFRIIDIESRSKEPYKLLPHPTFIYAAKFKPESMDIVCTGGYDKVIRVWSINNKKKKIQKHGELLQELFGHHGYINSICFSANGLVLYSADSAGSIKSWNSYNNIDSTHKGIFIFILKCFFCFFNEIFFRNRMDFKRCS
jgi:jouberin